MSEPTSTNPLFKSAQEYQSATDAKKSVVFLRTAVQTYLANSDGKSYRDAFKEHALTQDIGPRFDWIHNSQGFRRFAFFPVIERGFATVWMVVVASDQKLLPVNSIERSLLSGKVTIDTSRFYASADAVASVLSTVMLCADVIDADVLFNKWYLGIYPVLEDSKDARRVSGASMGLAVFAAIMGLPPILYTGYIKSFDTQTRLDAVRPLSQYSLTGKKSLYVYTRVMSDDFVSDVQFVPVKMGLSLVVNIPLFMPHSSLYEHNNEQLLRQARIVHEIWAALDAESMKNNAMNVLPTKYSYMFNVPDPTKYPKDGYLQPARDDLRDLITAKYRDDKRFQENVQMLLTTASDPMTPDQNSPGIIRLINAAESVLKLWTPMAQFVGSLHGIISSPTSGFVTPGKALQLVNNSAPPATNFLYQFVPVSSALETWVLAPYIADRIDSNAFGKLSSKLGDLIKQQIGSMVTRNNANSVLSGLRSAWRPIQEHMTDENQDALIARRNEIDAAIKALTHGENSVNKIVKAKGKKPVKPKTGRKRIVPKPKKAVVVEKKFSNRVHHLAQRSLRSSDQQQQPVSAQEQIDMNAQQVQNDLREVALYDEDYDQPVRQSTGGGRSGKSGNRPTGKVEDRPNAKGGVDAKSGKERRIEKYTASKEKERKERKEDRMQGSLQEGELEQQVAPPLQAGTQDVVY
jgi:hypothetical protein